VHDACVACRVGGLTLLLDVPSALAAGRQLAASVQEPPRSARLDALLGGDDVAADELDHSLDALLGSLAPRDVWASRPFLRGRGAQ